MSKKLALHFGEIFMKILTKIENYEKLQMHGNLHKKICNYVFIHGFMQIYTSFYEGQFKQQICNSFILLISVMVFNPFKLKMTFQSFQMV